MQNTNFHFEVKRKIFHLSALLLPLLYFFIPKFTMSVMLFLVTGGILYCDMLRRTNVKIKKFSIKFFAKVMRPEELNDQFQLSGMSFMFLGFLVTAILFPKGLAICSWFILIISDCLAALIGSKIGEKLENGKSLAGSVAFFSSAIFISIWVYFIIGYNTNFAIIIISSLSTAIAEFYSKQINVNDNLLIPLAYCFSTITFNFLL